MKSIFFLIFGLVSLANAQDSQDTLTTTPPPPPHVEPSDPASILNKVLSKYKSMGTYMSVGNIVSNREEAGVNIQTTTTFTIKLKKPNLYLITWSQTSIPAALPQGGAVWSDGTQSYLYLLMNNAYAKVGDDLSALGGASAISGGATGTIPSLFLPAFTDKGFALSRLKDPTIEKTELMGGDDCYVLSGSSPTSTKETFWISKSSSLILKYEKSLEPPTDGTAAPAVSEEVVEKALTAMGEPVTDENKKKVLEMMQTAKGAMANSEGNGDSTEMQTEITNPNLTEKDFQFTPPAGATLTDSLLGPQGETGKQSPSPSGSSSTNAPDQTPVVPH